MTGRLQRPGQINSAPTRDCASLDPQRSARRPPLAPSRRARKEEPGKARRALGRLRPRRPRLRPLLASLAPGRTTVKAGHLGVRGGLVAEYDARRIEVELFFEPCV